MSSSEPGLKRKLGLWPAALSGTGVIVGAGIYALIGEAAGLAGGTVWLAFVVAAVVASLTGVSYARLGHRIPKNSPEFQYARVGLGFRSGFLAGWLMIWAALVSAAAVALGFGGYFHALLGVPLLFAALGLVFGMSFIVWLGIQESVVVVTVLTLIEIAGLVLVITLGLPRWGEHSLTALPNGIGGVWSAATLIIFAYVGFNELGNLAEEMRNPEKDLPRAVGLAVLFSAVLYILVGVSAVSLIGWQALAGSSAPLADAVESVLGETGGAVLSLVALAATGNTVLLLLVSASRSLYGMARAGALPQGLGVIGVRHTPWRSILVALLIVCIFVLVGDIAVVAQITNFSTLISFSLVNLSLAFILRHEALAQRGNPVVRLLGFALPVLGFVSCLWLAARTGWLAIGLGAGVGVVGWALGTWLDARRKKPQV